MLESLPPLLLVWVLCVILVAGLLQGALGFGFPFVATPLIALVSDMRTAIILVLLPTLATICVALLASGPLRATLARFWMMPLYMILGSAAGTWVFVSAPQAPYTLVLALLTLFYLSLDRLGRTEWAVVKRN
ncbi:MAG TPA: sulfite exporter TauE/SafE family protein, partial [Burkholderiales bacterium]|nr:sulfite exporter TauE/SafE family protein [Burkholderiales bacterium]